MDISCTKQKKKWDTTVVRMCHEQRNRKHAYTKSTILYIRPAKTV